MNKKKNQDNNKTSFIIVAGIIVLCIFTIVSVKNILPINKESDSYYVNVDYNMKAKIESLDFLNNKLKIVFSNDTTEYCVKTTQSTPKNNSLCWKKVKSNTVTVSIYNQKKYYIWIKDSKGNISAPKSFNPNYKKHGENNG